MKKIVDGLILIVLCIFLFTACEQEQKEQINFEEIANAVKIEVTHCISGTVTTETIEDTDTINQVANWLNELLLYEVSFSDTEETPTDVEGGESYSFVVYESERNENFDYIINSEDCYILYHEKWYAVKNPVSITFVHNI